MIYNMYISARYMLQIAPLDTQSACTTLSDLYLYTYINFLKKNQNVFL